MKANHTPGPWEVTPAGGIAGDGEVIIIGPINNGFGCAADNALLIAAAPEMFEVLGTVHQIAAMTLDEHVSCEQMAKALAEIEKLTNVYKAT